MLKRTSSKIGTDDKIASSKIGTDHKIISSNNGSVNNQYANA